MSFQSVTTAYSYFEPEPGAGLKFGPGQTSRVSYRKSEYRYQTKYLPKPWEDTETEPT